MGTVSKESSLEISWSLRYADPAEGLRMAREYFSTALAEGDEEGMFLSEGMTGVCDFQLNMTEHVYGNLNKAILFCERNGNHLWHSRFLIFRANAFHNEGKLLSAVSDIDNSIRLAKVSNDNDLLADALSVQGFIFRNLHLHDLSLSSFRYSLSLRREVSNLRAVASSLNQIAYSLSSAGKPEESLASYNESEKIRKENGFDSDLGYTYLGKASVYEQLDNHAVAANYYEKGISLAIRHNDKRLEAHCALGLGRIKFKREERAESESYLNKALELSSAAGATEIRANTLEALSYLNERTGNHSEALQNLRQSLAVKAGMGISETLSGLHKEVFQLLEESNASLRYSQRIQRAILPGEKFLQKIFEDYLMIFLPFAHGTIGGDFYYARKAGHYLFFAVADCTGHGVPGALTSMLAYTALNSAIINGRLKDPGEILNYCNRYFHRILGQDLNSDDVRDGMDISLISFNETTRRMFFSGANNSLYKSGKDGITIYKATRGSINRTSETIFSSEEIEHTSDDLFYMLSDGFVDQFGGPDNKKFGSRRFMEMLSSVYSDNLSVQRDKILNILGQWMGMEHQIDDILLAGFRLKG